MRYTYFIYILIGIVLLCFTFMQRKPSQQSPGELSKLKWMIGTWKNEMPEGVFYEVWTQQSDSTFVGSGSMIVANDTVFSESLMLKETQAGVEYIATVADQNNGGATAFGMIKSSDKEVVFENKTHDFPQQIIYRNPQPDSLYAVVQGQQNGKLRTEIFAMKKVKHQ